MIKLAEIYKQIFKEAKQVGDVYHFTSLKSALSILARNILQAHDFTGDRKTDFLAISTTRDKNFIKTRPVKRSFIQGNDIAFQLDGNKLSNKYQSRPYNDVKTDSDKALLGDEQEQLWYGKRIQQDKGIKNIRSYIKKIIITKKLKEKIVDLSFDIYALGEDQFGWDFELSPQQRLKSIIDFFENYNISVEVQK